MAMDTAYQADTTPGTRTSERAPTATKTAHTCSPRAAGGQVTTNHTRRVGRTSATKPTHPASGRGGGPRPLVGAQPGCIQHHGKCHPQPRKQPVTGKPLHSLGEGGLQSSGILQVKLQG